MPGGSKQSVTLLFLILAGLSLARTASAQTTPPNTPPTFLKYVQTRTRSILDDLQSNGDWDAAAESVENLFDLVTLYAPEDHPDALREADLNLRLVTQLRHAPLQTRMDLLTLLRSSPNLTAGLVYMMRPDEARPDVFALLDSLQKARPTQVEAYASLAAAISLVHATPFELQVNENKARAIDPIDLFDYYVRNESRMFYRTRSVPTELLVYVVDDTGSIAEMNWALSKYQGARDVGKLFFDIQYDYESFLQGTPKQVTVHGFSLPNILRYGGVCADQAYFATHVGKAIGVPTAYTVGDSGESAHAWVGFLQNGRNGISWNFDSGRYDQYKGVRGNVMEPTTRKPIPDTFLSLTAEMIGVAPAIRQNAAALSDAARRLMSMEKNPTPIPTAPTGVVAASIRATPRTPDTATELTLLDAALQQSVGCSDAWFAVRDLALDNKLSPAQKGRWADLMLGFGARKYPDFTLSVVSPMVSTIADATQQDAVWNKLFAMFQTRLDLAAGIRMDEAAMWDRNGNEANADRCYRDVIARFANAGPFVLDALDNEEKVFAKANRTDLILPLYDQTWRKMQEPEVRAAEFMMESNWYRVGQIYADKLKEAGLSAKAVQVERMLAGSVANAR
jgi:hypothetical protein